MKRALKIVGITFGSLLGLVILVVGVVCYMVLTPKRLTPIVNNVAASFVTCEYQIGEVDLTFLSTFPRVGLRIQDVQLINPMSNAQSDTVLVADELLVKANIREFLQNRYLVVDALQINGLSANVYFNANGDNNLNIIRTTPDTTQTESNFVMPFDSICVTGVGINARRLTYVDDANAIRGELGQTQISLSAHNWDKVLLSLAAADVCCSLQDETYADHVQLSLNAPASIDLNTMHFELHQTALSINEFGLTVDGAIDIQDTMNVDATIQLQDWSVANAMALLPPSIAANLKDITADGQLSVQAHAAGIVADNVLPMVDATVVLKNGTAKYADLPYTFTQVAVDADAHLDLNSPAKSHATLRQLAAKTKNSQVAVKGTVTNLLTDLRARARVNIKVSVPDFADYIPETMQINGQVAGSLDVDARLSDITEQRFSRLQTDGDLQFTNLDVLMDGLAVQLPSGKLQLHNIPNNQNLLCADVSLVSTELLTVTGDSLAAQVQAPQVTAHAEIDPKDTTAIPTFDATIGCEHLKGYYAQYKGELARTSIEAKMTNSRKSKTVPVFSAVVASDALSAVINEGTDEQTKVSTQQLKMEAKARYNKDGEKLLLQWNPRLQFELHQAEADLAGFDHHISVPEIAFSYNNRVFEIFDSQVVLGKSDFELSGKVENIGKWIQEKGDLVGVLNFTSNHTDVNELMSMFSADEGSEEEASATPAPAAQSDSTAQDEPAPFMVPEHIDLTLNTNIKEAIAFNTEAHNLGGRIYVRDGILVLEEVGFVCEAAKLQLTAMYRTPRRNHLYLGLDYHMLDVKIDQLIHMIPEIDSMMPMLRSFKGEAEFHLAAETYLNDQYEIKPSTIRGACSIFGKDLVLLDNETFGQISKILMFKKKTENIVDSISAEITIYKKEIDIYPFCVSIDNYMAALGGRHNLDMTFDYNINLLSPLYLGVNVKGSFDDLSIKPAKCIYAQDFRPIIRGNVNTQNAELRQLIRDSLRKSVKTE